MLALLEMLTTGSHMYPVVRSEESLRELQQVRSQIAVRPSNDSIKYTTVLLQVKLIEGCKPKKRYKFAFVSITITNGRHRDSVNVTITLGAIYIFCVFKLDREVFANIVLICVISYRSAGFILYRTGLCAVMWTVPSSQKLVLAFLQEI